MHLPISLAECLLRTLTLIPHALRIAGSHIKENTHGASQPSVLGGVDGAVAGRICAGPAAATEPLTATLPGFTKSCQPGNHHTRRRKQIAGKAGECHSQRKASAAAPGHPQ